MPVDKQFPVYGDNGLKGTLFAPARFLDKATMKRVRLDDGRELEVPPEALEAKPDGSFYLRNFGQPAPPARPAEQAPPVYSQGPQTHGPLFREDCEVKRVRIMRLVDQPAEPRQDGDTYIVPLS